MHGSVNRRPRSLTPADKRRGSAFIFLLRDLLMRSFSAVRPPRAHAGKQKETVIRKEMPPS